MNWLAERRREAELMDDPALEPARHAHALRGLAHINWLSGGGRSIWKPVRQLTAALPGQALRVLDLATGGGDVPIRLWRRARRAGLNLTVHGCDVSATALEVARARARLAGADVTFFHLDVARAALPADFDVVMCSLFLHHLADDDALALLCRMRASARRLVLVNDLRRGRVGYLLAWVGTRIVTRSPVVHVDGPRSVAAAFSLEEMRALALRAGMASAAIARRWPCRYVLEWRKA